jgi:hypothetical protein
LLLLNLNFFDINLKKADFKYENIKYEKPLKNARREPKYGSLKYGNSIQKNDCRQEVNFLAKGQKAKTSNCQTKKARAACNQSDIR